MVFRQKEVKTFYYLKMKKATGKNKNISKPFYRLADKETKMPLTFLTRLFIQRLSLGPVWVLNFLTRADEASSAEMP
jgi:hypothetical protein